MLSCGWCVEETSADSADALSVVNCKVQCHILLHSSSVCRVHLKGLPVVR